VQFLAGADVADEVGLPAVGAVFGNRSMTLVEIAVAV
jgi:hypothetical protein